MGAATKKGTAPEGDARNVDLEADGHPKDIEADGPENESPPDEAEDKYPIERGVPVPLTRGPYDWESMESGDSKVVPTSASSSARSFVSKNRKGWSVVERRLKDDDAKCRVWFVKDSEESEDHEAPPEHVG